MSSIFLYFFVVGNHRLPLSGMAVGYAICKATLVWELQAAEFGMVFAGDILDVMSDGEERLRFEACEHKHTTSPFILHLAKAELAVPFFCTEIHYIVLFFTHIASFLKKWHLTIQNILFFLDDIPMKPSHNQKFSDLIHDEERHLEKILLFLARNQCTLLRKQTLHPTLFSILQEEISSM